MNHRACPVCSYKKNKQIKVINKFNYGECTRCRHIFILNPNDDTSSPLIGSANIKKYKKRHKQIIKLLDDYFYKKRSVKVAEIGSGIGCLAYLIEKNQKYKYVGYELSKGRYEFSKKYGLNIVNEHFKEAKNTYDVIIMDNVLVKSKKFCKMVQAVTVF
jgi:hypothetical protein